MCVYGLGRRATVDFKIIEPRVLTYTMLVSPRTESRVQPDGQVTSVGRYMFVSALEGDGGYWVVLGIPGWSKDTRALLDKDGHFYRGDDGHPLAPFIRVAHSSVPITSVGGSVDAAENLRITWTDATGKESAIELDAERNPRRGTGPLP